MSARREGMRAGARLGMLATAVILAAGAVALGEHLLVPAGEAAPEARPPDPARLAPGFGPRDFAEALAAADREVEGKRALLAREPGDWLRMEGVARALLARARLTADAADLAEAGQLLERGVRSVPWPAGPALSRAGAALAVHDLDAAERALARFDAAVVAPTGLEAVEALSMRCEIAFERGRLAAARRLCGQGDDDPGRVLRRANMALAGGDAPRAAALVDAVLAGPRQPPRQLAAVMLQRAAIALSAGDWQAADAWANAANRVFPGWWLAQAYDAQNRALEGDAQGAESAYRAIAARTGNPDVYGALGALAAARGDEAAAGRYRALARAGWDARAALLPAAYGGHFAEHLAIAGETERALAMAGADHARRPYLQPLTDYVFVLEKAGHDARLVEIVESGERAGFRSATLALAKAGALGRLGRRAEAAHARTQALRLNPRIEHPRQAFVHFRQD